MDIDVHDRVALVTGAGRGNGKAIAEELAANGATVVVNDLEEARPNPRPNRSGTPAARPSRWPRTSPTRRRSSRWSPRPSTRSDRSISS